MLVTIPHVLSRDEVVRARTRLEQGQWQDGAESAGTLARGRKRNEQLPENSPLAVEIGNEILRVLGNHPLFISAALPEKIYPPRFNRYVSGGEYGTHVDSAVMRIPGTQMTLRSDLSATLFLSEPEEYDGGELEIEGHSGVQAVKLPAGDMILYPSGSLHRVTSVTSGTRIAAFFWIESLVSDVATRTALFDLDQAIQGITRLVPTEDPHLLRLTHVYHNLLRNSARR